MSNPTFGAEFLENLPPAHRGGIKKFSDLDISLSPSDPVYILTIHPETLPFYYL